MPAGKDVLDASLREAQVLGHDRVREEHVLLALLADPRNVPSRALASLGLVPAELRDRLLRATADAGPR